MFDTPRRRVLQALGIGGLASLAGCQSGEASIRTTTTTATDGPDPDVDRIAADPTAVPDPVDWRDPRHHEVTLTAAEVTAEIEDGVTFSFMTFDGRVPGPMLRVRQGDTVTLTLENAPENVRPHNVDLHAVYGTGGGSVATTAAPGEENAVTFRAEYPGAFVYHCAVPSLDVHVSSGMFGLMLVEPPEGLPAVDRELYLGQHEVYTDQRAGSEGHHDFDRAAMTREEPTYVLFNGESHPFTADRYGPMIADRGETVRVYFVNGGPNLSSSFHPIGNVWSRAWQNGALANAPDEYVQTMAVPPGSAFVGDLDTPVPGRITLVDHALSRVVRKGLGADIEVRGETRPAVFDPRPGAASTGDGEGRTG
ncbi:MAG: copper-containing nitrite reductase [Halanaeroarchaeum sp.]